LPSSAPTSCLISARIAVEEPRRRPIGGDVAAEKIFEFENAARRGHVLLGGHARDGRFVQAELVGDLAQRQRPHRHLAVLEELALAVDDRLRDALDRVEALLHVLDQPLGLLQLAGEAGAALPCRMSA
jgi:hypothetical protein